MERYPDRLSIVVMGRNFCGHLVIIIKQISKPRKLGKWEKYLLGQVHYDTGVIWKSLPLAEEGDKILLV